MELVPRPGDFDHDSGDKAVDAVDNSDSGRGGDDAASRQVRSEQGSRAAGRGASVHSRGGSGDDADRGPTPDGPRRGADLARDALAAARAASAEKRAAAGGAVRRPAPRRGGSSGIGGRPRRRGWSSSGPDDRDPQSLGRIASRLSAQRGWAPRIAHGSVFGRWAELVGPDVAEHATPVALRDGELTVQAESTAWATQLRLLQRQLLARIAAGLGHGVVTSMRIHGPTAPSWRRGPRHVSGRGPRDTYG